MEFSAGFVPFRQSLDFHFNVCDRYIPLSLSLLGWASCLFNLINWRSVSHKFAHFKNAQKTLNSPVVVRAIDRYDTCGQQQQQQQGLDCPGLVWLLFLDLSMWHIRLNTLANEKKLPSIRFDCSSRSAQLSSGLAWASFPCDTLFICNNLPVAHVRCINMHRQRRDGVER